MTGMVTAAFDRMRPKRLPPEVATITIGDKVVTRVIGSQSQVSKHNTDSRDSFENRHQQDGKFARKLQQFSAGGTQSWANDDEENDEQESITTEEEDESVERHNQQIVFADENPNLRHGCLPAIEDPEDYSSPADQLRNTQASRLPMPVAAATDDDSIDEEHERLAEEKRVTELIKLAEDSINSNGKRGEKRSAQALKTGRAKDSIISLVTEIEFDIDQVANLSTSHAATRSQLDCGVDVDESNLDMEAENVEERLSLNVSKTDFLNMHIIGQFNLGFILAVRPRHKEPGEQGKMDSDELFIIDQHASDEKYNFERLQAETVVGNQRMVRPALLDLTAVEEEIVMDNAKALEKNGFVIEVDRSGAEEVGKRCHLVSLPLSKEVVFGTNDLDELIHMLAESPMLNDSSPVPRPSKVRKMFAMRACRSSTMIGKTLSHRQMATILQHMGTIDKPWNCPHGRPTMRHLASLDTLEAGLWQEGDGVYPGDDTVSPGFLSTADVWSKYLQ